MFDPFKHAAHAFKAQAKEMEEASSFFLGEGAENVALSLTAASTALSQASDEILALSKDI